MKVWLVRCIFLLDTHNNGTSQQLSIAFEKGLEDFNFGFLVGPPVDGKLGGKLVHQAKRVRIPESHACKALQVGLVSQSAYREVVK